MMDAPRQNWDLYRSKTQPIDDAQLRAMTPQEKFAQYANLFTTVWEARKQVPGDWERLEQWHWEQKLAMRRKMVDAFHKRDQLLRERADRNNAG